MCARCARMSALVFSVRSSCSFRPPTSSTSSVVSVRADAPEREQARGVTSYETDLLRRKNSKACSTQQQRPYKHGLFFLQLTRDVQASF